jgi:peroxiredoxin (alkyl hydroperoxide reductase subunit C)
LRHGLRFFLLNPKAIMRAFLHYPLSDGRNFPEIKRLPIGMQTTDSHDCATPTDWQPGADVIVTRPGACGTAYDRLEMPSADTYAVDRFMILNNLLKQKLNLTTAAHD